MSALCGVGYKVRGKLYLPDHGDLIEDIDALPLPARDLNALLRQLDDNSFAVRERATAELLRLADGVEPDLRQALKRPLSPEPARRVKVTLPTARPARRRA